ncbi:uncharacterized protein LOC105185417 isoform X2 [Harpegnathos saltator]|uniref:uncharacterized protein LOC105185417 isoform X2 n=1 Tax=Harpegnathos saltator TaxID=610380 RepID=UPI00058E7EC7|nr:uncharacterized protein LOC105185417 isoform X2 [Harpegnathos saltator]
MPACSARNCKNRSEHGFRMFLFPRDEKRKTVWAEKCDKNPTLNARLCEYHFDDSQFENRRQDGWRKLKPNAIPTIFGSNSDPSSIEQQIQPTNHALSNFNEECGYNEIVRNCENVPSEQQTQLVPIAAYVSVETDDEITAQKLQTKSMINEEGTIQQANEIKYLLKQLEQERTKSTVFKSKYENEKILRLKTTKAMETYKKRYITLSKKLEKSPIFKQFILGLSKQKTKWSPQCLQLAIQIRYTVGWKAYLYLKKDLGLPLPSYSTLCRYITKFNFQPDMLRNVPLLMIKKKETHKSSHQNDCVILMDEMDIQPALGWLSQHNYCKENTIQ